MNEIFLNNASMPVLCGCDFFTAAESFYHADRTVDFNILIYVIEGAIYVTEEDTDYSIGEGEMLFLKSTVHHYGRYEIQKGTRWYYIHFSANSDIGGCSEYGKTDSGRMYVKLPKFTSGLSGSDTEWQIADFIAYANSTDKMKGWNINLKLSQLLSGIAQSSSAVPLSLSQKICRYLDSHYTKPFSVKIFFPLSVICSIMSVCTGKLPEQKNKKNFYGGF